jgi:quercetin dioxygenase-like cupin family protein
MESRDRDRGIPTPRPFVIHEEHGLRPGSAVFIPGGAEHGVRNTGAGILRLLYAFAADSFAEVEYEFSSP